MLLLNAALLRCLGPRRYHSELCLEEVKTFSVAHPLEAWKRAGDQVIRTRALFLPGLFSGLIILKYEKYEKYDENIL